MDRAAKVVRRSGVRLLSLGAGHSDLNMVISELKDVRNGAKSFMTSQSSASEYMLKWAASEENRAIQDVSDQVAELSLLWTDCQRDFLEQLKEYRHAFDMILEGEKRVSQARANLAVQEQKDGKAKRDLKKAAKKGVGEELRQLENKYLQAERARSLAQIEVNDIVQENEAVKMIRFKESLLKISEAYADMAANCAIIFNAQKDIAHQLPDVCESEIGEYKYVGAGQTKRYVVQARHKLQQHRRKFPVKDDPPPPYSYVDLPDNMDPPPAFSSDYDRVTSPPYTSPPVSGTPLNRPIIDIEGYIDRTVHSPTDRDSDSMLPMRPTSAPVETRSTDLADAISLNSRINNSQLDNVQLSNTVSSLPAVGAVAAWTERSEQTTVPDPPLGLITPQQSATQPEETSSQPQDTSASQLAESFAAAKFI